MNHATVAVQGIPLVENSKAVPPGWKEEIETHPFRLHLEKLKLGNRITDIADGDTPALIVGRIKGDAYRIAMDIGAPRVQAVDDGQGNLVP